MSRCHRGSPRTPFVMWPALFVAGTAIMAVGANTAVAQAADGGSSGGAQVAVQGQVSSTFTQVTGGDTGRAREDRQTPEPYIGGLDELTIDAAQNAWKFSSDLRARSDVDLQFSNRLERTGWGYLTQEASVYPHYYDASSRFYDTAPRVYDLDTTLRTLRGDVSLEAGSAVEGVPRTFIGYHRRMRDGETNSYWGGWLRQTTPNDNITFVYPLQRERDEQSNTLYFGAQHQLAGWNLALRQDIERFEGVDTYDEPGYYDNGVFQFTRYYRNNPKHTTWTTTAASSRDALDGKVRLNLHYQYAVTQTDSTTDVDSFNSSGTRHIGEHSLNYNVAEHAGRSHSQTTGLQVDYTPVEWVRTWIGGKFLAGKSVGTSMRGEEGSEATAATVDNNAATVEEWWASKTINREIGFTEEVGVELNVLPKTRLAVDMTLDQNRAKYDWVADVTGPASRMASQAEGDWAWLSTWWENRNSYTVSARTWAVPHLTLWGRYRYRIDTADVDDQVDNASEKTGDPEYETGTSTAYYYPGRIEDTRRGTHEFLIAPTVKLGPRWTLNPRFTHRSSHYEVSGDPIPEISAFRANTVAVGVLAQPLDALSCSVDVSRQFALTSTRADSFSNSIGKNPRTGATDTSYYGALTADFDASYSAVNAQTDYTWHGLTFFSTGGIVDGNGDFDTTLAFGGVGLRGAVGRIEGARWETAYRFYDYHEDENNGINDYTTHAVMFIVRMPFEFAAQSASRK